MTYTVQDEQTFAPLDDADELTQRRPTLPAPPIYRAAAVEATRVEPVVVPDEVPTTIAQSPELSEEERKLAAERAARREAREAALAAPDVRTVVKPEPIVMTRRSTDRFAGSFGLFVLRLVVAAILAVRGLAIVTDLPAAEAQFAATIIPEPSIMAMVTGFAALAIAVALVFGLLTRLAGFGVMLIAGGALALVQWGSWSPFVTGRPGFLGELELLLATVGLLLLCVGGGGFSLDRSFRKSREKERLTDQA